MRPQRPQSKRSRVALFCLAAGLLLPAAVFAQSDEPKPESETLKLLKQWKGDDPTLAALFATGQSRERELAELCHNENQQLRGEAYGILLLLGSTLTPDCAKNLNFEDMPAYLLTADELTATDLDRVEKLIVRNPCADNQPCQRREIECPHVDESLGYALILNGSTQAFTVARQIATLFRECRGEGQMIAEPFLQAEAMRKAPSKTRNLQLDRVNFESAMKQSAFFVPEDQQKAVSAELLARNEANTRMLAEVSYTCGPLCGSGYYVVLKKNSAGTWDYVLVSRAWIS